MTSPAAPPQLPARLRYVAKAVAAAAGPLALAALLAAVDTLAGLELPEPWRTGAVLAAGVAAVYRTPNGPRP